MRFALGVTIALAVTALQTDPARVLADMRQALGGDAAMAAVQAFSVTGVETRSFDGHTSSADVEFACVLPDRYIKVRRIAMPIGDTVETHGFNGDTQIRRRASAMPYPPDGLDSAPPDQKAARMRRAVRATKHEFARMVVAMIGLPAADPVDVSYAGQDTLDGRLTDVLLLRARDNYEARLYVDAVSHLPSMISWMGSPEVIVSTTSTQVVRNGEVVRSSPMTPLPSGDPTAGLAPVEHRQYFSEYRLRDGLNWPRRLKETVSGRPVLETRLNNYKINPKIDEKRFDPSR
jgi:hypothetical protein